MAKAILLSHLLRRQSWRIMCGCYAVQARTYTQTNWGPQGCSLPARTAELGDWLASTHKGSELDDAVKWMDG